MSDQIDAPIDHDRMAQIAAEHGRVWIPGMRPMSMPRVVPGQGPVAPHHQQRAALLSLLARQGAGAPPPYGQGLLSLQQPQPPATGLLSMAAPPAGTSRSTASPSAARAQPSRTRRSASSSKRPRAATRKRVR